MFVILQFWRSWMSYRQRKGKHMGPGARHCCEHTPPPWPTTWPGSTTRRGSSSSRTRCCWYCKAIAEARSHGVNVGIDVSGVLVPGDVLDYIALATFAIAWIALLLNLSGTAVQGRP